MWPIISAIVAVVVIAVVWRFIFRAAMRHRNDKGEFTYRDTTGG
jgi:hypothetical protein